MPSDRSRTSDDLRQNYKAVVTQQGRVILDRDFNALQEIVNGALSADAADIIGPCGTPDNGFEISPEQSSPPPTLWNPPAPLSPPAAFEQWDFLIAPGTMYIGGQRGVFPARTAGQTGPFSYSYFDQPDWIYPTAPSKPVSEVIWLRFFENEVGAVEDPDLLDVALGGPDTTQRVRLMRRVERADGTACADAAKYWNARGYQLDPITMRLVPQAALKVSFPAAATNPDPCDPVAMGGYVGAFNQLIRVEARNEEGGSPTLLWGYDNASFLYRVTAPGSAGTTLTLAQAPVDAFHQPLQNQVVEVLRMAAVLANDPNAIDPTQPILRCVAEARGYVTTLSQPYVPNPDGTGTVQVASLPPEYSNDLSMGRPLFLRVWQGQASGNLTASGGVELVGFDGKSTSLFVTLTIPSGGTIPDGAFWMIAVRPSTPQLVYPERFLESPQPPDGPSQWMCPLAVINWAGVTAVSPPTGEQPVVDCRDQFYNLVELTKLTGATPLVAGVLGMGVYGGPFELRNGDTLAGSDLARGLTVLLNRNINPASATRAACYVEVEIPFVAGGQTVAYQSLVLAADVSAPVATEISLNPNPGIQQYLISQLANLPAPAFANDWDTFSFGQIAASWTYAGAVLQASVSSKIAFNTSQEVLAINKQALSGAASGVSMAISPAPNTNQTGSAGLIFNYVNSNDYWGVTLSLFPNVTEDDGFVGVGVTAMVAHYVNGLAQQLATNSSFFGNSISKIYFSIAADAPGLSFAIELIFSGGGKSTIPFARQPVPGGLVAGSRVGLFTGVNGNTDFAELAIEYSGTSQPQILLPPPPPPLLSRLTVKGGLLEFTDQTRTSLVQAEADFSMWFWLQPQTAGGYYGYGAMGIGSELI